MGDTVDKRVNALKPATVVQGVILHPSSTRTHLPACMHTNTFVI